MIQSVRKNSVAIITGSVGVLLIILGFVVASRLSCAQVYAQVYVCPKGVIFGRVNPHPYFDILFPWLFGGVLVLFWAAYRYTSQGAKSKHQNR